MKIGKFVVLAILGFATTTITFAQTSSTSVRGTVTDPSGSVVPNAQITLENAATNYHASQVTNTSGEYTFPSIPPGTYKLTVTETGFAAQSKRAELLVNQLRSRP
jgi:protocatechuate 3,4-dioxygenase beta subunit